jgi:hypothetical protein
MVNVMGALVAVAKPLVLSLANNPQVKLLVISLLEKYVKSTDNSIDDTILATVKAAMFKDQITGQVSALGQKLLG